MTKKSRFERRIWPLGFFSSVSKGVRRGRAHKSCFADLQNVQQTGADWQAEPADNPTLAQTFQTQTQRVQ